MSTTLESLVSLAKKERTTRRGRRGYSDQLKDGLRELAKSHTKARLAKETGISYPTLQNIIGKTRKPAGGARTVRRAAAKPAASALQISVTLPSGTQLSYTSIASLKADAEALQAAVGALS